MSPTPLQNATSAAQNLATGVTVQSYTPPATRLLWAMVRLSGLNGAAATFTVQVRNTTDTKTVDASFTVAKATATDTGADITIPAFVGIAAKAYGIKISSSNASDTAVGITVEWYDATLVDATHWGGVAVASARVGVDPTSLLGTTSLVYLATTGNDANDGQSWATAKATLAGAVAAVAHGGLIQAGPGVFAGTAADGSAKNGVTLRGTGIATEFTRADFTDVGDTNGSATLKVGPGWTVERCFIKHTGRPTVNASRTVAIAIGSSSSLGVKTPGDYSCDDVTIRYCKISGACFAIQGAFSRVKIHDNVVLGSEYGIALYECSGEVFRNTIRWNNWAICNSSGLGIYGQGGLDSTVIVWGNRFTGFLDANPNESNIGVIAIDVFGAGVVVIENNAGTVYFAATETSGGGAVTGSAIGINVQGVNQSVLISHWAVLTYHAVNPAWATDISNNPGEPGTVRIDASSYDRLKVIGPVIVDEPQSGDSYARIGAAGAGLTALGDARLANLDATIGSRMATFAYTVPPTAVAIAAAVEVEILNDNTGGALMQALADKFAAEFDIEEVGLTAIRDAILNRVLAGNHETVGSVGKLLQFLDALVSSRQASGVAVTLPNPAPAGYGGSGGGGTAPAIRMEAETIHMS